MTVDDIARKMKAALPPEYAPYVDAFIAASRETIEARLRERRLHASRLETVIDDDISAVSERLPDGRVAFSVRFRGDKANAGGRVWIGGEMAEIHEKSMADAGPEIKAMQRLARAVRSFVRASSSLVTDDEWIKARNRQASLGEQAFTLLGGRASEKIYDELKSAMDRREGELPEAQEKHRVRRHEARQRQYAAEWDESFGGLGPMGLQAMKAPRRPQVTGDPPKVLAVVASGYLLIRKPRVPWYPVAVGSDAELNSLKKYMQEMGLEEIGDRVRSLHGAGSPVMGRRTPAEIRTMYKINYQDRRIPASWRAMLDRGDTPRPMRPVEDVIREIEGK